MGLFDSAKDKAMEFANDNPDKLKEGVDKGGDFVDDKTGDKYSDQINKGQEFVGDRLGGGQGGDTAQGTDAAQGGDGADGTQN